MDSGANLVGLEIIVVDLGAAVQFCHGVLGLELIDRRPSPDLAGEVAVFALGNAAITLLQPAPAGEGVVLNRREPRLAQIFLGVAPEIVAPYAEHMVAAGAPVHVLEERRFFVPSAAVEGALGISATVTVLAVDDGAAPAAGS